jgi:uncharacterized membrane protein YhaH (DUF805 family)
MANFCENCGSPLKNDNKFCPNCGAPVKSNDSADSSEPAMPPASSAGDKSSIGPVVGAAATATTGTLRTEPAPEKPQDIPPANYSRPKEFAQGGTGSKYEPDDDLRSMFLRFDNRLNRKRYIKRSLALMGIAIILIIIAGIIATLTKIAPETAGLVISCVLLIPAYSLMIRRLHDLNRPAWWCILSIIQVVLSLFFKKPSFMLTLIGGVLGLLNFVLGIYLLFFKGTDGPNQYGPDPLEGQN